MNNCHICCSPNLYRMHYNYNLSTLFLANFWIFVCCLIIKYSLYVLQATGGEERVLHTSFCKLFKINFVFITFNFFYFLFCFVFLIPLLYENLYTEKQFWIFHSFPIFGMMIICIYNFSKLNTFKLLFRKNMQCRIFCSIRIGKISSESFSNKLWKIFCHRVNKTQYGEYREVLVIIHCSGFLRVLKSPYFSSCALRNYSESLFFTRKWNTLCFR